MMFQFNRKNPEKIYLNVYDLSPINSFVYPMGLGFYHSGLEVFGKEYTFGGGGGVFDMKPKDLDEIPLRESILIGETWKSFRDIDYMVFKLKDKFQGDKYNIITKNCNSFADALCREILGHGIPGYVNRMANWGKCFEGFIPEQYKVENVEPNNIKKFKPFDCKGQKLNF